MAGTLYLLPNTLGESALDSVLPRDVLSIAASLDYFVAENAKSARAFLKLVNATTPLIRPIQEVSIRELNVNSSPELIHELLAPVLAGRSCALISEAGCPAIADPGADLVALAHQRAVRVRPLVGPSSILLSVMASGLNGQSFAFNGYLPIELGQRATRIRQLETQSRAQRQTQIFIETPYRNVALLKALVETCAPATRICVAIALTLSDEWVGTQRANAWSIDEELEERLKKRPAVFLILA